MNAFPPDSFLGRGFQALARRVARTQPWRTIFEREFRVLFSESYEPPVPLGNGLYAPRFDDELAASFAEIFLHREYEPILHFTGIPTRWLDLGCYAGFFSLWLMWARQEAGLPKDIVRALLVDADARLAFYAGAMIRLNGFGALLQHLHRAIGAGSGAVDFVSRGYMASSLAAANGTEPKTSVRILSADEVIERVAPPYDLIKVDIEGAERELLEGYAPLLRQSRFLVMEWHSWHSGRDGKDGLVRRAAELGFATVCEVSPARDVRFCGRDEQCGILLFENKEGAHP